MSTKTPTGSEEITEHGGKKSRWLLILALVVVVVAIAGVVVWQVFGDDESTTEGVSAEVEEEITALIDDWHTAINEGDGQAALALFTVDGRLVSGRLFGTPLDGWAGGELEAQIEGQAGLDRVSTGSPLIIVRDNSKIGRPDSYRVAQSLKEFESSVREYVSLYNIVDEEGTLKFRYVEEWAAVGWFQLTENSPYQPVGLGE